MVIYMKRRSKYSILLILLGVVFILFVFAIPTPPYIELPWDDPKNWTSNSPNSPQFEIMYDQDKDQNVMRLYGEGKKYNYILLGPGKTPAIDTNKIEYLSFLRIDIKNYDGQDFLIFLNLQTQDKEGNNNYRWMYYEPVNYILGHNEWGLIYHALGSEKKKR